MYLSRSDYSCGDGNVYVDFHDLCYIYDFLNIDILDQLIKSGITFQTIQNSYRVGFEEHVFSAIASYINNECYAGMQLKDYLSRTFNGTSA